MYCEDFISNRTKSVTCYGIAVISKTGHSYTHQDTVVFTQNYFIPSSTAKQWLQKSATARGAPFFNLVLASAIHHMNFCVTIKGGQNFNLGSRRAYSIFVGTCKSADHALDCIASTVKHEIRNKYASMDKQNKQPMNVQRDTHRGELSYLVPLGSENISAPYFKQCFFQEGGITPPPTESNTTPPGPKTEITNILFYTGCPRRNGPNFGRVFLMLNYTDITQNTYIQS